jgi:hypothetical protein
LTDTLWSTFNLDSKPLSRCLYIAGRQFVASLLNLQRNFRSCIAKQSRQSFGDCRQGDGIELTD